MLRSVVLKYPANILHMGTHGQIAHKNHNFQYALRYIAHQHGVRDQRHSATQQGGQQEKQANRHADAQHYCHHYNDRCSLFTAQRLFQPKLKLGGLLGLFLLFREKLGGIHQRLYTLHHGSHKGHHTPHKRQAQQGIFILDQLQLTLPNGQLTVGLTHHDGLLLWPAHHDAFDQRLTAAHGLETALRAGAVFLLC